LDVLGLNYAHTYFEKYHGKYKLYGSETTATLGTRGEYRFLQNGDAVEIVEKQTNHQESAYSLNPMEGALTPEQSVIVQKKHPWSAGEFAWCGFDYLGEPHHASDWSHLWTPARSSYWGMIDLAGFPKDVYYFYQSQWTKSLMAHLLPHWNWNKNMKIPVWCYSNADSAELFLNGKSQGIAKCYSGDTLHFQWEVNYEPGELKVIARRGNEE